MNRLTLLSTLLLSVTFSFAQTQSYISNRGQKHLCGPMTLADLQDTSFAWYAENYEAYQPEIASGKWVKQLKKSSVDIYIGTWCGDSKRWLPRFVKTWEALGLSTDQLNIIALYNDQERYKQGPNGEEKGKGIHRIPTFIFTKDEEEIGRIVEVPNTDLITDIAQIALGYPSRPTYKAADYVINLLKVQTIEEIQNDLRLHINTAYKMVGKSSELNTLGYIFLRADMVEEAMLTFQFNTYFFRNDPNVYDSYGEALAVSGDKEKALKMYRKVLELDPENENALDQIAKIEAG